jgi:hypothetical protein
LGVSDIVATLQTNFAARRFIGADGRADQAACHCTCSGGAAVSGCRTKREAKRCTDCCRADSAVIDRFSATSGLGRRKLLTFELVALEHVERLIGRRQYGYRRT